MKNKIVTTLLVSVITLTSAIGVYADTGEDEKSIQTPPSYHVRSKSYVSKFQKITKYLTHDWAKAKEYQAHRGEEVSYGLSVEGNTSEFFKALQASGQFSFSKTYTRGVTTVIPANSSRYSKLAFKSEYKKYRTSAYKQYWTGRQESLGTKIVNEPTSNTYTVVVYK